MNLSGIWIKVLALFVGSAFVLLCGIYAYKKLNWKSYEFYLALICSAVILIFGLVNGIYAINPKIEQINANYIYVSSNGVVFGREYHFQDSNGNSYDLTMDPITTRKVLKGEELNDKTTYLITYEKRSNTIIDITY